MAHTMTVGSGTASAEQRVATSGALVRVALLVAIAGGLLVAIAGAITRAHADMNWTGDPTVDVVAQFGD